MNKLVGVICSRGVIVLVGALLVLVSFLIIIYPIENISIRASDESLHIRVAQEMFHDGNFLSPTLHGTPYFNKPPLKFWLMQPALWIFGETHTGYRAIDSLAAIVLVALVVLTGRILAGHWLVGFLAGLFLLGCHRFVWRGAGLHAVTMDTLLIVFGVGALLCLFLIVERLPSERYSRPLVVLAGLFIALGVLTKSYAGFVPLFIVAPYLIIRRRCGVVKERCNGLVLLVVSLLPPAAYYLLHRMRSDDITEVAFRHELVERFSSGFHGRENYFLYFETFIENGIWPFWPAIVLFALGFSVYLSYRGDHRQLFLLTWIAVPLIGFSLLPSRLERYAYIIYPAVALLLASTLRESLLAVMNRRRLIGLRSWLSLIFLVFAGVALVERGIALYRVADRSIEVAKSEPRGLYTQVLSIRELLRAEAHSCPPHRVFEVRGTLRGRRTRPLRIYLDMLYPYKTVLSDAETILSSERSCAIFLVVVGQDLTDSFREEPGCEVIPGFGTGRRENQSAYILKCH